MMGASTHGRFWVLGASTFSGPDPNKEDSENHPVLVVTHVPLIFGGSPSTDAHITSIWLLVGVFKVPGWIPTLTSDFRILGSIFFIVGG
jgi:hypothetical protein